MAEIICTETNVRLFRNSEPVPCDKPAGYVVVIDAERKKVYVERRDQKRKNVYCADHANKQAFIAYRKTIKVGTITAIAEFGVSKRNPEGSLAMTVMVHDQPMDPHFGIKIRIEKAWDFHLNEENRVYTGQISGGSHGGADMDQVRRHATGLMTAVQLHDDILEWIGDGSLANLAATVAKGNALNTAWDLQQVKTDR